MKRKVIIAGAISLVLVLAALAINYYRPSKRMHRHYNKGGHTFTMPSMTKHNAICSMPCACCRLCQLSGIV